LKGEEIRTKNKIVGKNKRDEEREKGDTDQPNRIGYRFQIFLPI
jgi:hypothetical protein